MLPTYTRIRAPCTYISGAHSNPRTQTYVGFSASSRENIHHPPFISRRPLQLVFSGGKPAGTLIHGTFPAEFLSESATVYPFPSVPILDTLDSIEIPTDHGDFCGHNSSTLSIPDGVTLSLEAFRQYFRATPTDFSIPTPAASRRKVSSSSCYTLKDVETSLRKTEMGLFLDPHSLCSPRGVLPAFPVVLSARAARDSAKIRRRAISERTRALERLMPWSVKMDTATMLEHAFKYVKFLQSQVSVLKWMPARLSSSSLPEMGDLSVFDRISRQQLLHILVTSPYLQKRLLQEENCIVSMEQVVQKAEWAPFVQKP